MQDNPGCSKRPLELLLADKACAVPEPFEAISLTNSGLGAGNLAGVGVHVGTYSTWDIERR